MISFAEFDAYVRAREREYIDELVTAKAAVDACRGAYGVEPVVYPLLAGSGPMAQISDTLGILVAGFGSGNAASANHAPNENIAIVDYVEQIRAFGLLHTFAGRPLA